VIGGLLAATMATLTVLPALYAMAQRGVRGGSLNWNPRETGSR